MEKKQLSTIYLINESNSMIYLRIWLVVGESPLPAKFFFFFLVSSEILAYTIMIFFFFFKFGSYFRS